MDERVATLVSAIEGRRVVTFVYSGKPRVAEPQCIGVAATGKTLVRVYLPSGEKTTEPLFEVALLEALRVTDRTLARPGPNDKRNDSAMVRIIAQL